MSLAARIARSCRKGIGRLLLDEVISGDFLAGLIDAAAERSSAGWSESAMVFYYRASGLTAEGSCQAI